MTAPTLLTAALRGLRLRCPQCGAGKLFTGYTTQAERCTACGAATGAIEADDGPPWMTLLLIGPFLMALTLFVTRHETWPAWISLPLLGLSAIGAALLFLPRMKGLMIGVIWSLKASGEA